MGRLLILFTLSLLTLTSFAQIRDVPADVKQSFEKQYPGATDVDYDDHLVGYQVHFFLNNEKMTAAYTSKGKWKFTEKNWQFEALKESVKDGFEKSKYFDWKVIETKILYKPGNVEQYRIKVEKNTIQKKNLIFNKNGRLVEDSITI